MTRLSVNINKIALIRNARNLNLPNILQSSKTAIKAGAYGITVHPRPDQRHITYADCYELADELKVEFNIEGNPFTGRYTEVVCDVKPTQATLVPDQPQAVTSDHGWNLQKEKDTLKPVIKKLKDLGIRVSLFVDPQPTVIELAKKIAADRVELYTEPYATAFRTNKNLDQLLQQYADAAKFAQDIGLGVNAGHDLNTQNLQKFCSEIPRILEVSIGQALIVDALEIGLYNAVKEYVKILQNIGE
jgi:pyridoxine 5-phosphate synthase